MAMQRIGNYYGTVTESLSQDGHTIAVHMGPWQKTVAMRNVLCEDGKERTIYTRDADTFFTVPGRTSAYGKTVTGFVSYDSDIERFTFKAMGKYRDFLTDRTT
jgi:hypothetical protein